MMYYHFDLYDYAHGGFLAAEGVMYWCVQSYETSVKNSTLTSNIVSTWYLTTLNTTGPIVTLFTPRRRMGKPRAKERYQFHN